MFQVDEQIAKVDEIYQQITGKKPQRGENPYSPIPPEVNAENYVQDNLKQLFEVLQRTQTQQGEQRTPQAMVPPTVPRTNIFENEREWICVVDLPGVDKGDVNIQIHQGMLTVFAYRREQVTDYQPVHMEVMPTRFERTYVLPQFLKGDSAQAKLNRGVLTITFQKNPETRLGNFEVTIG